MREKITNVSILETMIQLANEKSLLQVTLQDLATRLYIKTPSLYNHIKGIDDLYMQMCFLAIDKLKETLLLSSIGLSGREAIISMANEYINFSSSNKVLYESIENPLLPNVEEINLAKKAIVDVILKILQKKDDDVIRNTHIIRVLRSYLHGFSMLNSNQLFHIDIDTKESFEMGLIAILDGFEIA